MIKHMSKRLSLLMALGMVVTLFSGCQSTATDTKVEAEPLKITAVCQYNENPEAPRDPAVLNAVKENVKKAVGREVIVEWVNFPPDTQMQQWLQAQEAAGTMPDVVALYDMPFDSNAMEFAVTKGLFHEFTSESIKKDLPKLTANLNKLGLDVNKYVDGNKYNDGKLYYLPIHLRGDLFPKNVEAGMRQYSMFGIYNMVIRDDILKMIYPNAKSEAELMELYKQKGNLTMEDFTDDIPIKNMDDMYEFLSKVKALNLKVGDKQVIPGALNSSSESTGSLQWSMQTAMGLGWRWPLILGEPYENSYFLRTSDTYKNYMKWWNKLYNEKLVDPELFVMKNDQYTAKMANGEYAVFNAWGPVAAAREKGKERGYGFRPFPMFYPLDFTKNNQKIQYVGYKTRGIFFSKKIKTEVLPDVMKWADYFMSSEADELAAWGSPEFYTGNGKGRKFKPEYKDLENWAVYGITGGKDGKYYGLTSAVPVDFAGGNGRQLQINPFSLVQPTDSYMYSPYYVYKKDNPEMLSKANIDNILNNAEFDYIMKNAQRYEQVGWTDADITNVPEWAEFDKKNNANANIMPFNIKVLTGKPEDFETNWTNFVNLYKNDGIVEAEKAAAKKLAEIFNTKLKGHELK